MSNYISAKQFLSLDKKVQDSIIKWWEPQMFDLTYHMPSGNCDLITDIIVYDNIKHFEIDNRGTWPLNTKEVKDTRIPILTETQLRTYIEYKIKDGVNIKSSEDGYTLKVETDKGKFVACSEDLMECYLEIAVKVS